MWCLMTKYGVNIGVHRVCYISMSTASDMERDEEDTGKDE